MMSFAYRDRRLAVVDKAIDRLSHLSPFEQPPPQYRQAFLKKLRFEQTELKADRHEVSDGFCAEIAAAWIWSNAADLVRAATLDFALRSLLQNPALTPQMATAVQDLPRNGSPDAGYFDKVTHTIDAGVAAELAGIALGFWLQADESSRINPFRDIAVMLPLRLETLFKKTEAGNWRLLLRVTPDEPSILRDEPTVSQEEADYLSAFWQRSASAGFADPPADWLWNEKGVLAWAALCDRVGAPRAAWMVAEFPPQLVNGSYVCIVPTDRIGKHPDARVSGLPPKLNVTAIDLNGSQFNIGSLSPVNGIKVVMPTDADTPGNWLTDWSAAKNAGLGAEFDLPDGIGPDTISTLYVCGVGDEDSAAHFSALAQAGTMGLLNLGASTNSVAGAAGADLGKDQDAWLKIASNRMRRLRGSSVPAISSALCGNKDALPDLPGGAASTRDSRLLAQALWPALWGHYFRDVWGCGDDAHALWSWVHQYLSPEGPLPPLRIDTQPYGLLPVTSLEQWQRSGDDPVDLAEERVVAGLRELLPQWAGEAEKLGTVAGSDEAGLLDFLGRTGVSSNYDYRTFVPAELLASLYPGTPLSDFLEAAYGDWERAAAIVGVKPAKLYSAIWGAEPLELPLIGARRMPLTNIKDLFVQLYEMRADRFGDAFFAAERTRAIVADSLLIRLMIWSAVVAKAWYMQSVPGASGSLLNLTTWLDPEQPTPVESLQTNFQPAFAAGNGQPPAADLVKQHRDAIMKLASVLAPYQARRADPYDPQKEVGTLELPAERQAELERALRATLDTASHRLDPWATGVAWHRHQEQAASGRVHRRLGAYGWLDGPFLGKPGPNDSGRLHAPSYNQAITSIVLRDKYLSSRNELTSDGRNIWKTELNSAEVRTALEIAQEIRLGFHVYEVVGRRVEEIVGGREQIKTLRKAKPLRPERPDPRDVCNGLDALAVLLGSGVAGVLSNDTASRAKQTTRLKALQAGIDAFADLLLAEGVYNVVGGNPERAADAMDAAAGFARPPEFGVVRTPPSGYRLTTNVVAVMPYRPPVLEPQLVDRTPLEIADASLAAFVEARLGKPDQWIFPVKWSESGVDHTGDISLAALGMTPLQAALLPHDFLAEVVRQRLGRPQAVVDQAAGYRLMRQIAGAFGVHPAMAADLAAIPDKAADNAIDSTIRSEIFTRYDVAYQALAKLAKLVEDGTTDADKVTFLRKALSWGFLGPARIEVRQPLIDVLFANRDLHPDALTSLVGVVETAVLARLKAAPDPSDVKTQSMSAAVLARAISDLVAPGGTLAITARWPVATLRGRTKLQETVEPALDRDWLPVVAAVRPALARVEAVQLEASTLKVFAPLAAWTSAAPDDDPWRTGLVSNNATARSSNLVSMDMSRLLNAYGADDAFDGADVAVALIDQFSEAVPMSKRTTYAAFGFNAPASRAPQAILLAVPGRVDRRISEDDTLQILIETRRQAHARAARSSDGPGNPIAPTMWFQAAGPLRVRLDSGTQYTR
jgi:hypothetical protein